MKHCRLLATFLVVLACLLGGGATAQESLSPDALAQQFSADADRVEAALEADRITGEKLVEERARIDAARRAWDAEASEAAAELAPLQAQLDALGTPEEGVVEEPTIAGQRARLQAAVGEVQARLRRAEQAATRAVSLTDRLDRRRLDQFRAQLLTRGPSPLNPERYETAANAIAEPLKMVRTEVRLRLATGSSMKSFLDRFALPTLISAVGLFFAFAVRRWLVTRLKRALASDMSRSRLVTVAVGITLARLVLPVAAVLLVYEGVTASGLLGPKGETIAEAIVEGMLLVIAAFALGGAYFAPGTGNIRISALDERDASRAHRWLVALAVIVGLDQVLVEAGEAVGMQIPALSALNAGLLVLGGIALWKFTNASRLGKSESAREEDADDQGGDDDSAPAALQPVKASLAVARVVLRLVAVLAPLLALAGYYAASRFIFYPMIFSGALIGICMLIYNVMREISLVAGNGASGKSERSAALPVLSGFVLSMIALPLLALIWGATFTDLEAIWNQLVEGFTVGDVEIVPIDFLVFGIVFAIGYALTRAFQGVMRRSVLPLTRIDEGAKSALLAGIGYVGIVLTALIAISSTGLDLSNLAIVAGALSVGIGFGLQNIVNNFVSGVILLIERPIKIGDWVEIGGTHGTVQRVNVRSTQIQTFDRSTMFVPNADLISGTVTNWTHGNSHGRLIVKVGVAYGSDVRQVEKILLQVAEAHPMLMRRPAPYIVFMDFGADSLNFEIRGVLRDVNWILNVSSDIRFSVYEKFQEAGIEIPFAQRDVHIRSLGGLEHLMPERPKGKSEDAGSDPTTDSDGDGGGG